MELEQLRLFLAVADAGSFSAAGRRLVRAQSAVSYAVASLEARLGVALFRRGARGLALTEAGVALRADARALVDRAEAMVRRARDLSAGIEPEVLLAVDVLFPMDRVVAILAEFRDAYPDVPARLFVEALGGPAQRVLERTCGLGVMASLPIVPPGLRAESIGAVDVVMVAAPQHPLASSTGMLAPEAMADALQLVMTDRSGLTDGQEFSVFSRRTWRIGDLAAKHALLLQGIGFGAMPVHAVADDLAAGRLVRLEPEAWGGTPLTLRYQLVRAEAVALGPATSALAEIIRHGA